MGSHLEIITVCANRMNQNCFVVTSSQDSACVVIDPGYGEDEIISAIHSRGLTVAAILATHGHFDHVASAARLQQTFDAAPFLIHAADTSLLNRAQTFSFAFKEKPFPIPSPKRYLDDGEALDFGGIKLDVWHTPGHTPGSCVFSVDDAIFTGDLLIKPPKYLKELPGSEAKALAESRQLIFARFPSQTLNYPGHGREKPLEHFQKFLESQDAH